YLSLLRGRRTQCAERGVEAVGFAPLARIACAIRPLPDWVRDEAPRRLLRPLQAEDLPRLVRRRNLAAEVAGDADHALDKDRVVFRELPRRDIRIVLVADAHMAAE